MTARRVLSLLSLAVCAAALAGCGGDTLSFDPVANAASKTAESTSSRVEFTATMNVDGVGGMALSGSGVFDGHLRSGALNMRFTLPADAQAELGGADPTMEMIMDGRKGLVMYMRSPLFKEVSGGKWLKLDMAKLAEKGGVDLSSLMSANQADPSQTLKMLMASTDAHAVGYDRVRGVFTTRYQLNVDLARLAKDNKELRKQYDAVRKLTGVSSYPAVAWIDKQGRVRRMKIDMSFNTPAGGAFRMSMTEELYAFGIKVDVRPPDASQVLDAGSVLGG
ncbi:MAG TPA: hypothetical protein VK490_03835 [Gaiellaceae bacterium]|nr:hypothetical protein [Gaiellaceae bacterium]